MHVCNLGYALYTERDMNNENLISTKDRYFGLAYSAKGK